MFLSEETVRREVRSWVASVEGTALLHAQVLVQHQDSFVGLNSVSQYKEVLLLFSVGFTRQEAVDWLKPLACKPGRSTKPLQWELWLNEATP